MSLLLAAVLAALAAALAVQPPSRMRGLGARPATRSSSRDGPPPDQPGDPPGGSALRWSGPAALVAGAAAWLLVGGLPGALLGAATAVAVPRVLRRFEPARARRERLELQRSAPMVADLLAASLAAGIPVERSLDVIARAVGGVAGQLLAEVHRRMQLGESATAAWAHVGTRPGLEGIARAVARAGRTGAPLADLLAAEAADLRGRAASAALVEVRAASVRAVLPLGLCLLPAFGLLGIVPVVAGLLVAL